VTLAAGTRVNFGKAEGEIRLQARPASG
jgi:hypothetical protein